MNELSRAIHIEGGGAKSAEREEQTDLFHTVEACELSRENDIHFLEVGFATDIFGELGERRQAFLSLSLLLMVALRGLRSWTFVLSCLRLTFTILMISRLHSRFPVLSCCRS